MVDLVDSRSHSFSFVAYTACPLLEMVDADERVLLDHVARTCHPSHRLIPLIARSVAEEPRAGHLSCKEAMEALTNEAYVILESPMEYIYTHHYTSAS